MKNSIMATGNRQQGSIYLTIMGRLGNQFFQYAFARALQERFCQGYSLNISFTKAQGLAATKKDAVHGWQQYNALQDFRVKANYIAQPFKDKLHYYTFHSMFTVCRKFLPASFVISSFTEKLLSLLNMTGIYVCPSPRHLFPVRRPLVRNVSVTGYFEAHGYFDSIRDTLLEELAPIHEVLPHNKAMFDSIKSSESVCVHVRRGDFLSFAETNICGEEYFITAMKAIREELPSCKFFVFSDDVEAVRSTMHLPFDAEYERADNPPYESMHLMSRCKHFIISNSTFSWWAQYLSRNDGKIVYAPSVWNLGDSNSSGVYLPYMRTIQNVKL